MASLESEFETPKNNVFVTQLNERQDEDVRQYPIVKESAAKLVETGLNTLQKTLLLKKEIEVEKVDSELLRKREEFKARMEACAERRLAVQKKQQAMKDRVNKFEKFIKDNEAKRRRAIQKFQSEVKQREQKRTEFEILQDSMNDLQKRHAYLEKKITRYKKYEDYLLKVLDILPAHYLEVTDSMLLSLMKRHKTLKDTNDGLLDNLAVVDKEQEATRQNVEVMKLEHEKQTVSINSTLGQMRKHHEHLENVIKELEQKVTMDKVEMRAQQTEFGQIVMAINNIADKSRRRMDPRLEGLNLLQKLDIISDFVCDQEDIVRMSRAERSRSPSSERKSAKARP